MHPALYTCELPIGLLRIAPHRTNPASVELWFGEEVLGAYGNALLAADDVRVQVTESHLLDSYKGKVPSDLSEWTRVVRR
jgi:hypothetical protein